MKGAVVFVVAFVIFLAVTLFAYNELPLGNAISDALGIDPTWEWSGFLVRTLMSAILNGVVYGIIVWLVFTVAKRARE